MMDTPGSATMPTDPFEDGGIAGFARRLRAGETTAETATRAYLARIAALEPRLQAFEHVAGDSAIETARALDRLLVAGTDLGPLMGVPVAVKDLFAVEGMPVTAGSRADVADIIGPEGTFIGMLKRAGCVILGKTKTVEFAFGGAHHTRGTPWNPWDPACHRFPGGSSGGSGVAVTAGMCALAIGTDTAGSVRIPAAFCGVFGLKTTTGLWPTDGIFPLARSFDTVGLLTQRAEDAAVAFAALQGEPVALPAPLSGLRLGRPDHHFFDDIEPEVARCVAAVIEALGAAGAEIVPVEFPEAAEVVERYTITSPTELLAALGRDRFHAIRHQIDPDIAARLSAALEVTADHYIRLMWRRRELAAGAAGRLASLDGLVAPTVAFRPSPVAELSDRGREQAFHHRVAWNTRPANILGLCAVSVPVHQLGSSLPVGLQLICQRCRDRDALAVALAVEGVVGAPRRPELSPYL